MAMEFKIHNSLSEEIKVGGLTLNTDYSDEGILSYTEASKQYEDQIAELNDFNPDEDDVEKLRETMGELREVAAEFIDDVFGEDTFESLYPELGGSLNNVFQFINYVGKAYADHMNSIAAQNEANKKNSQVAKMQKYSKSKKK